MDARTAHIEPEAIVPSPDAPASAARPARDERVEIERFRIHRRLARELGERADAPLERLDLADDDLRGLLHERPVGRAAGAPAISSTVSRIGVSEFFSSCAVLRASDCQLDICVR